MIVISNNIVLGAGESLATPIFGWRNLVTATNVSATTEHPDHPAANLANPSTALRWLASPGSPAGDEYLTVAINSVDPVDYLAIARHNLGSASCVVSVEGASEMTGSPEEPDWQELVQEVMLPDDGPALFRFTPQALTHIRLKIQPGSDVPTVAVLYVGKLLVAERGIASDHTPINFGRVEDRVNAVSENGQFLGRIILSESRQASLSFRHLTPGWYRQHMDPFIKASGEKPFFVAWKPQEFPRDVGYCWMTNQPQPIVSFDTGRIAIDLEMRGVA